MDILLLLLLVCINGVFSMSEMAVVSSRRAKLQTLVDEGKAGAAIALALNQEPSRFLSAVQVGITSVGILSGAIGEAAIADPLAAWIASIPLMAPYAKGTALTLTVIVLTYFSVVIGELVPKRLALFAPELIASVVARPMRGLAKIAHPLVLLLSGSCSLIVNVAGFKQREDPPVTDAEINVMMEQGATAGVFHEGEQALVSNVLRLDDQKIAAIMTPKRDMAVIHLIDGEAAVKAAICEGGFSRLVVCEDGLETVLGVLQTGDLLNKALTGVSITLAEIKAAVCPPLYVPVSVTTAQLLENFKRSKMQFALIVDEYGEIEGLVTMADVLTAIVGDVEEQDEVPDVVKRADGSWLIDGDVGLEKLKQILDLDEMLPGEEAQSFHTVGGLLMHVLGHIPRPSESTTITTWNFEVVDMDKNRVDKVICSKIIT